MPNILNDYLLCPRIWKDMSLDDSLTIYERSKLAVWDYPVSDTYTKMWQAMKEAGLPSSFEEGVERVRASPSSSEGYAFLGKFAKMDSKWNFLCKNILQEVASFIGDNHTCLS